MMIGLTGANTFRYLVNNFADRFEYTRLKLKWLSFVGALGFPGFYVVWKFIFPQPYENMTLRLGGFLMCALLFAAEYRPGLLGRYHRAYAYATITLCLPFFFTFMALANEVNAIWLGSALCAVLYLTLLHDPLNLVVSFTVGTGLAIAAHLAVTGGGIPEGYWASLPVFGFALAGGTGLNLSAELVAHRSRLRAAMTLGGSIAHEMRTPLGGIIFDAQFLQRGAADLVAATGPRPVGAPPSGVAVAGLADDLTDACANILSLAEHANAMVDILLVNVTEGRIDPALFSRFSMAAVIDGALAAYPFPDGARRLVEWRRDTDFDVVGSDILMRHILFNLVKNALRAITAAHRGTIVIRLEPGEQRNRLIFRDTGTGVKPEHLPHLFEEFWSARPGGNSAGIGLTFVRRTVEAFGGTIACRSEYGHYTEFTISLPPVKG